MSRLREVWFVWWNAGTTDSPGTIRYGFASKMPAALTYGDAGQWYPRTESHVGFGCRGPVLPVRASGKGRTILIAGPYECDEC
jgi:hypothetical protein